jgi:hypothetical protein
VYIGRPGKWGNPFSITPEVSREEVIEKFIQFLNNRPDLIEQAKEELKGRDLICYCAPKACHGDILLKVANS